MQHPVLKKAKRRGTLTKEDEKNLPFEIKLKCGKAGKAGANDGGLDFRSLLKHVKARVVHGLCKIISSSCMYISYDSYHMTHIEQFL